MIAAKIHKPVELTQMHCLFDEVELAAATAVALWLLPRLPTLWGRGYHCGGVDAMRDWPTAMALCRSLPFARALC